MSDEGDESQAELERERQRIKQYQSEYARKREVLDRLKEKKKALEDELKQRQEELEYVIDDIRFERNKQNESREKEHDRNKTDAEMAFMRKEVKALLQTRIPAMAAEVVKEEEMDSAVADTSKNQPQQEDMTKLHDSVLVTYLAVLADGAILNYKVTYRIDSKTTVEMLHLDACNYWGCSPSEFCLCIMEKDNEKQKAPLPLRAEEPLQAKVLDASKNAHLHLIQVDKLQYLGTEKHPLAQRIHSAIADLQDKRKGVTDEKELTLKTLDRRGNTVAEPTSDSFVEAFRIWPGIYNLLHERHHYLHPWRDVVFRDICVYTLLAVLCVVISILRFSEYDYWMRLGIVETLDVGIYNEVESVFRDRPFYSTSVTCDPTSCSQVVYDVSAPCDRPWSERCGDVPPPAPFTGESILAKICPSECSTALPFVSFRDIQNVEQITTWMASLFQYQVFQRTSALRKFYTPLGRLRLRQKRVKEAECRRPEVPDTKRQPCYHVYLNTDTEDTDNIVLQGVEPGGNQTLGGWFGTNGSYATPDPFSWIESKSYNMDVAGVLQENYDGSGYVMDFDLSDEMIDSSGERFLRSLEFVRDFWFSIQTRVLVLELTLANYNLGCLASCTFLLEVSPSGVVVPTALIQPLSISARGGGGDLADVIDVFRLICILYILVVRAYTEIKNLVKRKRSGLLAYVLSVTGFIDQSTVAIFCAIQYMRLKYDPPNPATSMVHGFYSYSREAFFYEQTQMAEALLFCLVMIRWASLMKISTTVFKFWKAMRRSLRMFFYYLAIFLPIFFGLVFLAHSLWHPYAREFSTWWNAGVSLLMLVKIDLDFTEMHLHARFWTVPFMVFFFLAFLAFLANGFLAISVHSYFEVTLLHGNVPNSAWTWDQWLDWMLWGRVYRAITRGASKRHGDSKADEGGEEEEEEEVEEKED